MKVYACAMPRSAPKSCAAIGVCGLPRFAQGGQLSFDCYLLGMQTLGEDRSGIARLQLKHRNPRNPDPSDLETTVRTANWLTHDVCTYSVVSIIRVRHAPVRAPYRSTMLTILKVECRNDWHGSNSENMMISCVR